MAETKHFDSKVTSSRRISEQNRTHNSNNGRGRPNQNVHKALYNFGVSDLRQLLDKKRQEQAQVNNGPAPDPPHNYLKDPLRGNSNNEQLHKFNKDRPDWHSSKSPRQHKSRGGSVVTGERHNKAFIQNPVNIKIELSTATGVRSCILDEQTKLPNIKRIPNHRLQAQGAFAGDSNRGIPESSREQEEWNGGRPTRGRYGNESSRRRGLNGGGRSRGRGRGQGHQPLMGRVNKEAQSESNQPTQGNDNVEENWENESSVLPHEKVYRNERAYENFTVEQNDEYEEPLSEKYFHGDVEGYSKIIDAVNESEGNVILPNALQGKEGVERTVRFKLDADSENYQGIEIQAVKMREKSVKEINPESESLGLENLDIQEND